MKFIITSLLLISLPVFAAQNCKTSSSEEKIDQTKEITTDVPSHLKGATIIVRRADGKETSVPAELFKVVPRKQQFIVTKISHQETTLCSAEEAHRNRISLLAGNGPKGGLDRSSTPAKVSVESRTGAIGGVQYQRLLTERLSIGAQVQTNKSGLLNIGVDF